MSADKQANPLPIINWFDEPVKKAINSVYEGLNVGTESLDILRKFRKAHFTSLKGSIGKIKILGMSKPIDLIDLYSKTYVSESIQRRYYKHDWVSPQRELALDQIELPIQAKVPGDQYVEENDRIVVLGSPGSGKTTFLKHLALSYIDKKLFKKTELKSSKFPIYITLPSLSKKHEKLDEYIYDRLIRQTNKYARPFLNRTFSKGLAILLLDSLDEVPISDRNRVIEEILEFCEIFPLTKVVISCRTADYEVILENFYEIEIAKLSGEAVEKIVNVWFIKNTEKAGRLNQLIKSHKEISNLTETPLLLCLLCIQFGYDLSIPKMKTEFFRRCIDTLLREWDTTRGFRRETAYEKLSDVRKEKLFGYVAGKYFDEQVNYIFQTKELIEYIADYCERFNIHRSEAKGILNEIEKHHGIFEKYSMNYYQFSHPSFQEYFKARNLLATRTEFWNIKKNYDKDHWSSVIEFTVSMADDPLKIIQFLMNKSDLSTIKNYPPMARRAGVLRLLYRCMVSGAAVHPKIQEEVFNHLVDSQIAMYRIFRQSNVFPIALLMEDGVNHSYFYMQRKRETLTESLVRLRVLANDILLMPSERYSETVLKKLSNIPITNKIIDGSLITILGLIIPLASINPTQVKQWLLEKLIPNAGSYGFIKDQIERSFSVLKRSY